MREIERIYYAYLDEIENPPLEESNLNVYIPNKEKILEKFKKPIKNTAKDKKVLPIEKGQIYLTFEKHIPIYFLIYENFGNVFEVLKMSKWVELANHNDFITKVNDEWFIVETWNNFYMSEEEIRKSIFYANINKEDLKIIEDYKTEKINEIPPNKRGVYALSESTFQIKFHEKESEIVRKHKLKIFEEIIENNVLHIPPERENDIKLGLVAGKEKKTARGENFVIYKDKDTLKLIFPQNSYLKKGILKFFDEKIILDEIPEEIILETSFDLKDIDLDKLKKYISLEIKDD